MHQVKYRPLGLGLTMYYNAHICSSNMEVHPLLTDVVLIEELAPSASSNLLHKAGGLGNLEVEVECRDRGSHHMP